MYTWQYQYLECNNTNRVYIKVITREYWRGNQNISFSNVNHRNTMLLRCIIKKILISKL